MKTKKGTPASDTPRKDNNKPVVIVMGAWKIMHNTQTKENRMIPAFSEFYGFPGSPWDEVFSGTYQETIDQKKLMDQNGSNGK